MRMLLAGCAGFIGYHLTKRCLDDGHEVLGVDNIVTGQEQNVSSLSKHPNFRFLRHDVTGSGTVEAAFDSAAAAGAAAADGPFDVVFNLACPASPIDFDALRIEILAVCSAGTRNLLEIARRSKATFLQASTSEVYGDPLVHPQKESYWGHVNPNGPRSCYDEGKRFAEALIMAYRRTHGVDTRIVRIFNTYGPRMRPNDGRALPNFINQALDNQPITIHGDGKQTRSFCFVSDLVDGISRLALARPDLSGGDPVNIGNPAEITINAIVREVVELIGSKSVITNTDRPVDDPQQRRPDITRAQSLLGWKPIVERRDGLALTIDWFRRLRG